MDNLETQLIEILSRYCGERGQSEGVVETLERIIRDRDTRATTIVRLDAEIKSLRQQLTERTIQWNESEAPLHQQLASNDAIICGMREAAQGILDSRTDHMPTYIVAYNKLAQALASSPTCPHKEELEKMRQWLAGANKKWFEIDKERDNLQAELAQLREALEVAHPLDLRRPGQVVGPG